LAAGPPQRSQGVAFAPGGLGGSKIVGDFGNGQILAFDRMRGDVQMRRNKAASESGILAYGR
jgi:hypothetical protein